MNNSLILSSYTSPQESSISAPARITLLYIIVGGLWILLSDQIVSLFVDDIAFLSFLQTLKGWFFILWTGGLLYTLIQRDFSMIHDSKQALESSYDATLEGWVQALDLRDKETNGHTQRVTKMTLRLASEMGLSETEMEHIRRGAMLHDIGKMGVPDNILFKPDELSDEEWTVMRKHPEYAHDFLSQIAHLSSAMDIPYSHHERWDGTGYPCGLKGEKIPLAARIFSVVDVWDALRSDRPYRKAWPEEKVLNYIQAGSGTQFDPQVVDLFLKLMDAPELSTLSTDQT